MVVKYSPSREIIFNKIDNFTKFIFSTNKEITISLERYSNNATYLKCVSLRKPPFHGEFFSKFFTLRKEQNIKKIYFNFLIHGFKKIK